LPKLLAKMPYKSGLETQAALIKLPAKMPYKSGSKT